MSTQKRIPEDKFHEILMAYMETHFPTAKDAADHFNISRQYISYIMQGQKPANKDMLEAMGYRRFKVAMYQRISEDNAPVIEEDQFVEHIVAFMDARFESYPKAADHYGMSRQYMSNILNGDKPPNKMILEEMGYRRWKEAFYLPVDKDAQTSEEKAA